jgi:hypothetical protein
MLKFSVRKGRGLDFTVGLDTLVELGKMEIFDNDEAKTPEDMMAFIVSLDVHEPLQ